MMSRTQGVFIMDPYSVSPITVSAPKKNSYRLRTVLCCLIAVVCCEPRTVCADRLPGCAETSAFSFLRCSDLDVSMTTV